MVFKYMCQKRMGRDEAQNRLRGLLGDSGEVILKNDNDGEEVRLSRSSIRKITSPPSVRASKRNGFTAEQHYEAATGITDLYKKSFKLVERPDRNGEPDVFVQRYGVPAGFDDAIAFITIKGSTVYGKKVHDIQLIKKGMLGGTLVDERVPSSPQPAPSILNYNIRKLEAAVNS